MTFEIIQDFTFEAAHFLPNVGEGHRCRRLHGHTYKVSLHVEGPVSDPSGWVLDFWDLEAAFHPLLDLLDHHLLNEVPGLENPTAERIAGWILERLGAEIPGLVQVTVHENPTCRAVARR